MESARQSKAPSWEVINLSCFQGFFSSKSGARNPVLFPLDLSFHLSLPRPLMLVEMLGTGENPGLSSPWSLEVSLMLITRGACQPDLEASQRHKKSKVPYSSTVLQVICILLAVSFNASQMEIAIECKSLQPNFETEIMNGSNLVICPTSIPCSLSLHTSHSLTLLILFSVYCLFFFSDKVSWKLLDSWDWLQLALLCLSPVILANH